MNKNTSLWIEARKNIPKIFILCHMEYPLTDLVTCQNIPWQKKFQDVSINWHIITTMWILHMDTQQQCLCWIKCEYWTLPRFVPHVLKHKKLFGTSFKRSCPLKLQRMHINNHSILGTPKEAYESMIQCLCYHYISNKFLNYIFSLCTIYLHFWYLSSLSACIWYL